MAIGSWMTTAYIVTLGIAWGVGVGHAQSPEGSKGDPGSPRKPSDRVEESRRPQPSESETPAPPETRKPEDPSKTVNHVRFELRVLGTSERETTIRIEPAHSDCQISGHSHILIPSNYIRAFSGMIPIPHPKGDPIPIVSLRPDRDCTFKITVMEEGQKPYTTLRGILLKQPSAEDPRPEKTIKWYLSTPSVARRVRTGGSSN